MIEHTATAVPFGPMLRRYRTDTGLTQRMLADLSTVSVRAIRDLERGKARPRDDTMRLITDALRLGRRARADLEQAADRGRCGRGRRAGLVPDIAAPPTVLDAVIGRSAEVATLESELADLEQANASRLITIIGLPGVGKTRLAVEIAGLLHQRRGMPVLWLTAPGAAVAAAPPVRDPRVAALTEAAANTLTGRNTTGAADSLTALAELVGDRDALLVLDAVADGEPCPEPLLHLLGDCPRLRTLLTGDRPTGLPGERSFPLNPLPLPAAGADPAAIAQTPSAKLFLRQARRVRPGYQLTEADAPPLAEVCTLVDGLPPALVTAASWLDVYELPELREALRTDPAALLGTALLARLRARVAALPPADCTAVTALADLGPDFTLNEVMAFTGLTGPAAGLLLRRLLVQGVLSTRQIDGQSRFRLLALVRAAGAT